MVRFSCIHLRSACAPHLPPGPLPRDQDVELSDALPDPSAPRIPELLGGRYRTGRELGHGGMAHVYLARDTKHDRDVAIKVIRPELNVLLGHDRFLREIEIAARLRHPNIVPLYDSGEADGLLYFVMPFEDGPSLRARLDKGGALPIADALSVLRDVARALAYAHEHGVVHRDVKPDNVLLSGGAAVVMDFGIAKAMDAALTGSGAQLTQAGLGIGTPAYMAPEQAAGDTSTDHRADIYSFGCLAYELLTGLPPFQASSAHAVIAAHIADVPRKVTESRAEVPAATAALIARCLEKLPEHRPQSVRELLEVLDDEATTSGSGRVTARSATGRRALTGKRVGVAALVAVAVTIAAWFAIESTATAAPISLTVLPFVNSAADTAVDFLSEGLADELASALARVPGIQIMSRSGARFYRGQLVVDVAEAGTRLNAAYVMQGVVRRERGRWVISADIGRSSDRASIWGEVFTLNEAEQARAADLIAASALSELRRRLPRSFGTDKPFASASRTENSEAYRLYLRGQERLRRRGQSVTESAELFQAAIDEDPLFARAHSGLSMSLALFPYFQSVSAIEVSAGVDRSARRALALDASLSEPHVALGLAHQFAYRWDSAATEFETAVRLDPRDVEARLQLARHLIFRGRSTEALAQLRAAREEDPASALVLSWLSYAHYLEGRLDSALVESRRALDNDPTNYTSVVGGALVRIGANRLDEARALLKGAPPQAPAMYFVIARVSERSVGERLLADIDARRPVPWMAETMRALAYLGLGDTTRALAALERATDQGEVWPTFWGVTDPMMFGPVLRSARYRELLGRVGLGDVGVDARRD